MSKMTGTSRMRSLMRQKKKVLRAKRAGEPPPPREVASPGHARVPSGRTVGDVKTASVVVCTDRFPDIGDKLVMVGTYFRGDSADGFGFLISPATTTASQSLLETVRSMLSEYDAAKANPADLREQLHSLAARGAETFREYERLIALVNIAWLELRGHLKADEHNGVMWAVEKAAP